MRCSTPRYFYCWYMNWNLNNLKVISILLVEETALKQVCFPLPGFLPDDIWGRWRFLVDFSKCIFHIRNSKETSHSSTTLLPKRSCLLCSSILFRSVQPTGSTNTQEGLQATQCQVYHPESSSDRFVLHCKDQCVVQRHIWKRNDRYRWVQEYMKATRDV